MYNVMNEVDSKQLFQNKQINTKILLSDSWSQSTCTQTREKKSNTNYEIKSLSLTPEVRINLLVHRPERGW